MEIFVALIIGLIIFLIVKDYNDKY